MSSLRIRPGSFEVRFREVCDRVIPDKVFDKLYSNVGREARVSIRAYPAVALAASGRYERPRR